LAKRQSDRQTQVEEKDRQIDRLTDGKRERDMQRVRPTNTQRRNDRHAE